MEKYSFIEKLDVLKQIIVSSPFLAFVFIALVGAVIFMLGQKNKKMEKKNQIVIYVLMLSLIIMKYGSTLTSLLDGLMDNIFSTIYFPTPVAYIIMFLVTNILMLYSISSKKIVKSVKRINISAFAIISFLSFTALDLIVKNNINIYSKESLYTNTNLLVTIELAMILFAIWIIILSLIYLINKVTNQVEEPLRTVTVEERPIYQYNEPILTAYEKEIPSHSEVHAMLQKNQVYACNPDLYNDNGSVKFPSENNLKKVYYEKQQEQVNLIKTICQKDHLNLEDYKQLRNVLEIAVESDALEASDLEVLISKFE